MKPTIVTAYEKIGWAEGVYEAFHETVVVTTKDGVFYYVPFGEGCECEDGFSIKEYTEEEFFKNFEI